MLLCASVAAVAESEQTTLVYGSGDYTRINPAMDEHCEINVLLFDGLTDHDADNNIIPRLAKSWEYDEATMTYTFHLEEGVKWHDGEEFTAEDVKFTIEAIMDPENGAENAPNYEDVEEITVVDPYTVAFKPTAPNYAFLEYMTMAILPEHLLAGENMQESDFFRAPIGTGPYMLAEWDEGQAIVMEKNPEYFAGPASIDRIVFKIVPDDNAKALQLQSGELNLSQVTPKDAVLFTDDGVHTVYDEKTSDYRGILYNFWNPYWTENADLIPAISYAVDRQAILDAVLLGCGDIAYGPLQRNVYDYADVEHYDYAPEKAEELLASVGCEKDADGFWCRNGERISIVINATPGDQVRVDMAQIVAQQLQ
ncbi:MAG: ABC transporter substrate-binding protein, partial [Clostridia bacterium]|nr:ABC transporter substrate-binding protein [Clostridia bacterium]